MIKTIEFNYTGSVQIWTAPIGTTRIKIECFGARSGNDGGGTGGYGGYAYGEYVYNSFQIPQLYIYVGGAGSSAASGWGGGWNGGGNAGPSGSSGGGGGASDVRTYGDINWANHLDKRIIVAGGAGGAGNGPNGGNGGGLTGSSGAGGASGGTQISGGAGSANGSFGHGSNHPGDGGGGGGSGYGDAGGGGGSSDITLLQNSGTSSGINNGNGKVVITYEQYPLRFFLEKDGLYYLPISKYFDIHHMGFMPLTLDKIYNSIKNDDSNSVYTISNMNTPFTCNGDTFIPSNIIDFTKYKLYIFLSNKLNNVDAITINYTPSSYSLSQTTINIKDKYQPLTEGLINPYIDITGSNETEISYSIKYKFTDDVINKSCHLIDAEIIKDDFYLRFKFNNPTSKLDSVTLYENEDIVYKKIKDNAFILQNDFVHTFVTFKDAYNKVLANKITKQYFKYYNNTLDKF